MNRDRLKHSHLIANVLLVLAVLVSGETLAQNKNQQRAESLYENALKAKKAKDRLKLLREAVALHPYSAKIEYALGREFYQQARLDSAVAHFEQVIVLDPALADQAGLAALLPPAYYALASQHLSKGDTQAGLQAALAALRHNPEFAPAIATAAQIYYQLNRYDKAIEFGARLVRLQPTAKNHYNLAVAHEANNDLADASQSYRQALALDANLTAAQKNLERLETRIAEQSKSGGAKSTKQELAPSSAKSKNKPNPGNATRAEERLASKKSAPPSAKAKNIPPANSVQDRKSARVRIPAVIHEPGALRLAKTPQRIIPFLESVHDRNRELELAKQTNDWAGAGFWLAGLLLVAGGLWYYRKRKPVSRAVILNDANRVREAAIARAQRLFAAMKSHLSAARKYLMQQRNRSFSQPVLAPLETGGGLAVLPVDSGKDNASPVAPPPKTDKPEIMDDQNVVTAAAPAFGLQTEILFAEMIAASPSAFEVEENGEAETAAAPAEQTDGLLSPSLTPSLEELLPAERGYSNGESHTGDAPSAPWDDPAWQPPAQTTDSFAKNFAEGMPLDIVEPVFNAEQERAIALAKSLLADQPLTQTQQDLNIAHAQPAANGHATNHEPESERALETPPPLQKISRYLIEKEISKGATGRIYKAWDPKLDRAVVLKTVHYGFAPSPHEISVLKDRIYREARAIAKLNHPNIVVVYDIDDEPEFSYIVMEHLVGEDLSQILQKDRRLCSSRALEIATQVCGALEYAHQTGVFHRDIKPSNIMMVAHDEIKVMDFGIAKINNYLTLTQTGRVLGTPSYMAPEQIEGHFTDGRADLFSLGVVLYELLVGKRPFIAETLASLAYKIVHTAHVPASRENPDIPPALDEMLNRVLSKKPADRFQSAAEFRQELLQVKNQLG